MARNPIVLVHGLTDTAAIFNTMTPQLARLGWTVYSLDLIPSNGDQPLEVLAQQLANFIKTKLPIDRPFDLVGFSMGGIVSRYYLQRLGGVERIERFVSIASPHNGTLTGFLSWRPGCVQMRPNSAFLNDLNRDVKTLEQVKFTSIWTPMDTMIIPASSSVLPVGQSVQVQVPFHAWMVTERKAIEAVATALQN